MAWQADLFIRKALDDTGKVPYPGSTWTTSPDIIPNGTSAVGNPATTFGGASNYATDQGQPTVQNMQNYFYVRAKNLANGPASGSIYLYYCPQNLFLFPSLWNKNQMLTSSGNNSINITAQKTGDIAVTNEAFIFTPGSDIHSCLIARLDTPLNPNPLPQDGVFQTFSDLGTYIASHPNMGWRNVNLVPGDVPTFTNTFSIDTSSVPAGQNGQFLIGISYNNLTIGSQLAFSAGTPIPSGPDQGKVIQMVQTAVTQNSGSLGTSYLMIPAGYKTNVSYSYWAKPPVQKGWTVQFYAIYIAPPSDTAFEHGLPIHELGVPGLDQNHHLLSLANGISKGIRMGDVSTRGI